MAYDGTFAPSGPTVLVGTGSVQVKASDNGNPTSYRIRNILSTAQYIAWAPVNPNGAAVAVPAATAPTALVNQANTIGMNGNTVETFSLPPNCWFIANASAAFEVTPGEGQ